MTRIEFSYVTVSYSSPIVYYHYKDGAELGLAEMKEMIATAERLSWSRPYFTFSDVRVKMQVTSEARKYLADLNHLPFFRGAAALVQSSMLSFALNFLSVFQKKKYPFKAFTDEEKALEWLKSLPLDSDTEGGWNLM